MAPRKCKAGFISAVKPFYDKSNLTKFCFAKTKFVNKEFYGSDYC